MKCEVCTQNEHKYKCPKCKLVYCSLPCYKIHQENCAQRVEMEKESIENRNENENEIQQIMSGPVATGDYVTEKMLENKLSLETEDLVDPATLQFLDNSQELKNLLKNPHLRDLLSNLNKKSVNTIQMAMDRAMHEPLFTEFADVCLKIVQDKNDLNEAQTSHLQ